MTSSTQRIPSIRPEMEFSKEHIKLIKTLNNLIKFDILANKNVLDAGNCTAIGVTYDKFS